MRSGVAAVIIGNEVLTAKVTEQNGAHLIQRLRQRGVPLRMMTFVPDEIDAIVDAVTRARQVAQYVLTSGGIGPTHDDVTVRAVSLALGRQVVRVPELEADVKKFYGDRATPEALRLADAPEGAELLLRDGAWYPVLGCEGVFMLPGVPTLFRLQLETVLARLPGEPVHVRSLFLALGEPELAAALDEVALKLPEIAIGSYPQFEPGLDYKVKVTVEGKDRAGVEHAADELLRRWPSSALVRTEDDFPAELG